MVEISPRCRSSEREERAVRLANHFRQHHSTVLFHKGAHDMERDDTRKDSEVPRPAESQEVDGAPDGAREVEEAKKPRLKTEVVHYDAIEEKRMADMEIEAGLEVRVLCACSLCVRLTFVPPRSST